MEIARCSDPLRHEWVRSIPHVPAAAILCLPGLLVQLHPVAHYARALRPSLSPEIFVPARSRLLWLPVHAALITAMAWALATGRVPAPLWPLVSLAIGCCLGGVTFLGHEALHGAVVHGKIAIRIVGWFGFLPFCVSPQLWQGWHNRIHHNNTGKAGVDPDMYPTLHEYQTQPSARIMADHFGVGRRRLMGFLSVFMGFTGQSIQMLVKAQERGVLNARLHRRAVAESLLGVAFWATVAVLVGPLAFVFVYLLPLIVANAIVMAFIVTNHNLSPLTPVNDPLVNSLSVTLPRVLEFLTLDFGFHTEHHVLPMVSTRHGRVLRRELQQRWPDRYQSMPLTTAIRQLYRTARVYQDDTTLLDPPSGKTWPTLGARTYEGHAPRATAPAPAAMELARELMAGARAASPAA